MNNTQTSQKKPRALVKIKCLKVSVDLKLNVSGKAVWLFLPLGGPV